MLRASLTRKRVDHIIYYKYLYINNQNLPQHTLPLSCQPAEKWAFKTSQGVFLYSKLGNFPSRLRLYERKGFLAKLQTYPKYSNDPLLRCSTRLCIVGFTLSKLPCYPLPIGSMYGIFTYIWLIFMVNVGKYTIHGSYSYCTFHEIMLGLWFLSSLRVAFISLSTPT